MARWVAGLDGCRGGWAGVLLDLDAPGCFRCARFDTVADLLDGPERPLVVGIDIPIGLPERVTTGGRAADRAARAYLGASRSSVFPVPPRAAIEAADYGSAKALSRANSDPPAALSIQCWGIVPAIRAVDALLRARPDLVGRLREVHPEVAFRRLNGDRPVGAGKKTAEGLARRRSLLEGAGLEPALVRSPPPRGAGADDHLDAMAALVVARDILEGRAQPMPDPYGTDAHGLPIVIWAPARPTGEAGAPVDPC